MRRRKKKISKFRLLYNLTIIAVFFIGLANICNGIIQQVAKRPAIQRFIFWNMVDGIKYKIEKIGE